MGQLPWWTVRDSDDPLAQMRKSSRDLSQRSTRYTPRGVDEERPSRRDAPLQCRFLNWGNQLKLIES